MWKVESQYDLFSLYSTALFIEHSLRCPLKYSKLVDTLQTTNQNKIPIISMLDSSRVFLTVSNTLALPSTSFFSPQRHRRQRSWYSIDLVWIIPTEGLRPYELSEASMS